MSFFLDDISRILASPMPRRKALKLAGAAFAGGVLGKTTGLYAAQGPPCSNLQTACGTTCCTTATEKCCTYGASTHCISKAKICCGTASCLATQICCRSTASPFCAAAGSVCCGTIACSSGETCCASGVCCPKGTVCYKARCYASKA